VKWFLGICLAVLLFAGCESSGLENGGTAVVVRDAVYTYEEDDFEELASYINEKNEMALANMYLRGDADVVDEGTEVTIIDAYGSSEGLVTEVELPNGEHVFMRTDDLERD
jgi:hypothetical protein